MSGVMLISVQHHYHHQISAYCHVIFVIVSLSVSCHHHSFHFPYHYRCHYLRHLPHLLLIRPSFIIPHHHQFRSRFSQYCQTCLASLNSPTFGGIALHFLLSTILSDVPGEPQLSHVCLYCASLSPFHNSV